MTKKNIKQMVADARKRRAAEISDAEVHGEVVESEEVVKKPQSKIESPKSESVE